MESRSRCSYFELAVREELHIAHDRHFPIPMSNGLGWFQSPCRSRFLVNRGNFAVNETKVFFHFLPQSRYVYIDLGIRRATKSLRERIIYGFFKLNSYSPIRTNINLIDTNYISMVDPCWEKCAFIIAVSRILLWISTDHSFFYLALYIYSA